jgi:hypothetical protein
MALRDIRDLKDDPEEYQRELERRWTGLLSYRYIGRNHGSMNTGPEDNTVTLRRDMRNPAGGILLSVLSIAAPEGGAMSDLDAVPNPVVHSCQVLDDGRDVERIEVVTEVLKRGRQMSFSRSRIVDADNPSRVLALTAGEGVSIGTPPEALQRMDVELLDVVDSPDLPPLWQVFGATRRPDRHWALPELHAEIASPDAALHIGPQHVVLETAAFDLAAGLAGTDALQAEGSHVMFLARGKSGPFRVDGETFAGSNGKVGVQVVLRDEGAQDRAVTSASYVFGSAGVAS